MLISSVPAKIERRFASSGKLLNSEVTPNLSTNLSNELSTNLSNELSNELSNALRYAPGWPGIEPRWTSSAKTGVGTALTLHSRVWFTLSHGILNEIYFPRVDQACMRDQQFLVTDGINFFSEEKRDCVHAHLLEETGIPLHKLKNTCVQQRYRIEKEIVTD